MSESVELLGFGPFPPTGTEALGTIDLAVRLRDHLFTQSHIMRSALPALGDRIEGALTSRDGPRVAQLIRAVVDCWPVGALVDAAREEWTASPDADSLAVLIRAAELVSLAHGWTPTGPGPWPHPDAGWIEAQDLSAATRVRCRAPGDGAEALAESLGLPIEGEPTALAGVACISAARLVAERGSLTSQLARGELAAVWVTSGDSASAEAQLAIGECRLEGRAQQAFERYGWPAAQVDTIPAFNDLLDPPRRGRPGEPLARRCDALRLPGIPEKAVLGEFEIVTWLLWPGPHPPVAVHPAAAMVLGALDGQRDNATIAEDLGVPREHLESLLDELVRLGAASA